MKKIILHDLRHALKVLKISSDIEIEVFNNKNFEFGQYSTNFPIRYSKSQNVDIEEFSSKLIQALKNDLKYKEIKFEKGFINFYLDHNFLSMNATAFLSPNFKPNFENIFKKKINYEFVSANPTGYLHIGHARNAIVGDINCRVMEYIGHNVTREYYINDAGNQINDLIKSVEFYYKNPGKEAPADIPYKGIEITEAAKKLYDHNSNLSFEEDYLHIRQFLLLHFLNLIEEILSKIKIKKFNIFSSEQKLYESGYVKKVLDKLEATKFVYKKDDAIWLRTTDFGDEGDRVLEKKDKSFTYVMGDIAYHVKKFSSNYDILFNLWGADHKGYEKRIFAALEILGLDYKKLYVDFINMVQVLKNDELLKMSKRAGTSVSIKQMVEEINPDVLRFFMISKSKEHGLDIDINLSNKKDMSNPYWYSQYAYARICQILKKTDENNIKPIKNFEFLAKDLKENLLLSKMLEFEDIVIQAWKTREPYVLMKYSQDLSNFFHSYYNSSIVISENLELTKERLILIKSLKNLYNSLFELIGIEPIEKM